MATMKSLRTLPVATEQKLSSIFADVRIWDMNEVEIGQRIAERVTCGSWCEGCPICESELEDAI